MPDVSFGSPQPGLRLGPLRTAFAAVAIIAGQAFVAPSAGQVSAPPVAAAQAPQTPEFTVSEFQVLYDAESPGLPALPELLAEATARLACSDGGCVFDESARATPIADLNGVLGSSASRFSRRALDEVNRSIVRSLNGRGYIGVLVATNPEDLAIDVQDPALDLWAPANSWTDLRQGGAGPLRITIYTARVVEVRTVASGDRVPAEQSVNNAAHARIRERSPIHPAAGAPTGEDILRRDVLDDYTFRLNRHPGRRVDVAVSTAENPGEVALDYLVRENKPWFVYGQIGNSGTRETEEIRERFGIIHNQLTGHDDILVIDFITGGFGGTNALVGSYEFPITDRIRFRPFATYSKFDASQVGLADESFRGESWSVGGDISWNVFQRRDLFIDLVGGLRWENVRSSNEAVGVSGSDAFFLPSLGARLERFTDEAGTAAFARIEWNLDDIAATGDPSLENLGRTDPDAEFAVLQFGIEQTLYLEPLLDAKRFAAGESTLAHEVAVRFRAQSSLGARLAPTFQDVVGGMDTVRGYPESAVAGDDVYIGTAEYRLHIPRLLEPYDERNESPPMVFGNPFRVRPHTRYARPDLDVIAKAFLDVGRAENEDRQPFESDETLIGAGVGLEILVGRNINLRLDFGVPLREIEEPTQVTTGSSRLHFVVTVIF